MRLGRFPTEAAGLGITPARDPGAQAERADDGGQGERDGDWCGRQSQEEDGEAEGQPCHDPCEGGGEDEVCGGPQDLLIEVIGAH